MNGENTDSDTNFFTYSFRVQHNVNISMTN